jgi:hypothetical protein
MPAGRPLSRGTAKRILRYAGGTVMSAAERFLVFALEQYRSKKGLTGAETARLFRKYDIYDLIIRNYFIYHIESPEHFIQEIDEFVKSSLPRI